MSEENKLTTASGIPYYYNEDTMSAGPRGPLLLQDFILHEKMAHLTANGFGKSRSR
jgi:catalase